MSVVFHVTLLNILGFVHLPEKVLDKYFEIKGVLNLILNSICKTIVSQFKNHWLLLETPLNFHLFGKIC
jgi:hypothetical protein